MKIKHYIITRFLCYNFRNCTDESLFEETKLVNLFDLLNTNFIKTMENQTNQNFSCIILIHDNIDKDKVKFLYNIKTSLDIIILRVSELHAYIKNDIDNNDYDRVITSRLDCDDFIHKDVVDTIQKYAETVDYACTYGFEYGLHKKEDEDDFYFLDMSKMGYAKNKTGYISIFISLIYNPKKFNTGIINSISDICEKSHINAVKYIQDIDPNVDMYTEKNIKLPIIYFRHKNSDSNTLGRSSFYFTNQKMDVDSLDYGISIDGISIIMTAFNSQDFIEKTLDSIKKQTWFKSHNNYEILLGIDNCKDTLNKVKSIADNYDNLTIIYMGKNYETYITSNTLISMAKYNKIIRFDSDDIMKPNMVETIISNMDENISILQYKCQKVENEKIGDTIIAEGSICIRKEVFHKYGCYMPWKVGADSEILMRLKDRVNIKKIPDVLYLYIQHKNSLMNSDETNLLSTIRKTCANYVRTQAKNNPVVKTVIGEYNIVYSNKLWHTSDKVKPKVKPISKKVFLRSKHSYYGV